MTKRVCPFDNMPQMKVHVGNEGMERRDEMTMDKPSRDLPPQRLCIECNEVKYIRGNCTFCAVSLCNGCIKNCSLCSEHFCSRCCVAIFKNGNNFRCLTCYY